MKRIPVTLQRIVDAVEVDDNTGFCTACGAETMGVEHDARRYPCEDCGQSKVYGAEMLLGRPFPLYHYP